MNVINTEKLPIKSWAAYVDEKTLEQAENLANLPFIHKWVALMSDCHMGYGMPIGGVIATKGVVIPNAVGVDIGCGMIAVKSSLSEINTKTLKKIIKDIYKVIPIGYKHHKKDQEHKWMPGIEFESYIGEICLEEYYNAKKQIGTLGGGNHFIEIQKGSDNYIWIMIHSGSRNLGYKVAKHYNNIAIELNEKWFSKIPKAWGLAFLPKNSNWYNKYLNEMDYCVEFALNSRKLMMEKVFEVINEYEHADYVNTINIAHNYAAMEHHYNKNVLVHRKGATKASEGEKGIIPGSMGTSSYIVEGLGNKESFNSCSHGAGRTMSRTKAKQVLNLQVEQTKMKGIIHNLKTTKKLDEAPGAYKDIDMVMESQKDLVKIITKLTPIGVIKG